MKAGMTRRSTIGWWLLAAVLLAAASLLLLTRSGRHDDSRIGAPELVGVEPVEAGADSDILTAAAKPPAPIDPLEASGKATESDTAAQAALARRAALPGALVARFTGRVTDLEGAPVAKATVLCIPSRWTLEAMGVDGQDARGWFASARADFVTTATDSNGRFVVDDYHVRGRACPPDQLVSEFCPDPVLIAQASGWATCTHRCRGFSGGGYDAGTLELEPEVVLTGRLVDEDHAPVQGFHVVAWTRRSSSWSDAYDPSAATPDFAMGTSAADGLFEIRGVLPGSVSLRIKDDHFAGLRFFDLQQECAVGRVDVGDIGVAMHAQPARVLLISGVVVDEAGQPVTGAEILSMSGSESMLLMFARPGDGWRTLRKGATGRAISDGVGHFVLPLRHKGPYHLHVLPPGHEATRLDGILASDEELRIVVRTLGDLRLRIVDGRTSAAVPAPRVRAVAHVADPEWSAVDALPGFESLAAGSGVDADEIHDAGVDVSDEPLGDATQPGWWRIPQPGARSTDVLIEADGLGAVARTLQGVGPGQRPEITITLQPESILSGNVVSARDAQPIGRALVTVEPADEHLALHFHWDAATDGAGHFQLGGLGPGEWRLRARADGFQDSQPQVLSVGATPGPLITTITLSRAASIHGTLVDPEGRLAAGRDVELAKASDALTVPVLIAQTDMQGRFAFEQVDEGSWQVSAEPGAEATVAVIASEDSSVELRLRRYPIVRGRVLGGGEPVEDAGLYPMPGGGGFWATTGADGRYEFSLYLPGSYDIEVYPPAGRSAGVGEFAVDVDWDQVVDLDIELGSGRIGGVVVDAASGQTLQDVRVDLAGPVQLSDEIESPEDIDLSGLSVATGPDGRFHFSPLADGNYYVIVRGAAHAMARSAAIELRGGSAVEGLRLAMQPGRSTLRVTVRDVWGEVVNDSMLFLVVRATRGVISTDAAVDRAPKYDFGGLFDNNPGHYVFEELEPGAYTLTVTSRANVFVNNDDVELASEVVELKAGEVATVDMHIAAGRGR